MPSIELGSEVEDPITGFRGIAIGRTKWLTGCDVITVQPRLDKDGKHQNSHAFDEPRLIVLKPPVKRTQPPMGSGVG